MPDETPGTPAPAVDEPNTPAVTSDQPAAADETISLEKARELRQEAKNLRQRAKDAEDARKAAEDRLKEFEDRDLSEAEKTAKRVTELEAALAVAQAERESAAAGLAAEKAARRVEAAATKAGFADPGDAILYVGDVPEDEKGLEARLKAVLDAKPYLLGKSKTVAVPASPNGVESRRLSDEQKRANSYQPTSL